jgi:hypothetical protein
MSVIVLPQTRRRGAAAAAVPKIPVPPYDKPLPKGYWEGLAAPKEVRARERIRGHWVLGVLGFVLVSGALAWVTGRSTRLNETGYYLESMGTPNAESRAYTLAPTLQQPRVLRASLVSLPVRRAQLAGLPLGVQFDAHMPYGETVRCTYRGRVASQAQLPLAGNAIGDTYGIGAQQFVWVAPQGGVAQWIDP